MILDQAKLDNDVRGLLGNVSEVYTFMKEDGRLAEVPSMKELFGKLARQTLECADFIVHYSEIQSACKPISLHHRLNFRFSISSHCVGKRMGKNMFADTNGEVQNFSKVLDSLMQQFRDRATREIIIDVHRMSKISPHVHSQPWLTLCNT